MLRLQWAHPWRHGNVFKEWLNLVRQVAIHRHGQAYTRASLRISGKFLREVFKAMKNLFLAAALMAVAVPAGAQVGVSVQVGSPDFYGQINIGGAPAPVLVYPQPVVVAPAPQYRSAAPIYLRVPPGHAKHWGKHCAQYHACGRPVYFVRNDWYVDRYVPYYRGKHSHYHHSSHNDHGHHGHGHHGHDGHGNGHEHDNGKHGH
jgi:hypothetical protein